jgi:hypothetical protein
VKHIVQFSGGTGSWAAARRVTDQHGVANTVLLFADTLAEDEDLYRFLAEAAADIGVPVTRVCDGRTPEQVDHDRRWLSNSRTAQCSLELKIEPCRRWLEANCDPADTMLYVGIDWSEIHRKPAIVKGWHPWRVEMPLTKPPYIDRSHINAMLRERGIKPPHLNRLGFPHNNCRGACIRGGQAQWVHLLRVYPDRYAAKEAHEKRMRAELESDIAILRERRGGVTKPLTLTELRSRVESAEHGSDDATLFDVDDWGGCGCLTNFDEASAGGDGA